MPLSINDDPSRQDQPAHHFADKTQHSPGTVQAHSEPVRSTLAGEPTQLAIRRAATARPWVYVGIAAARYRRSGRYPLVRDGRCIQ